MTESRLSLSVGTPEVRVESQNYPWFILYERNRPGNIKDRVEVLITSPLSGALVSIPEPVRPAYDVAANAVLKKYGEPNPGTDNCRAWYEGFRVEGKWSCNVNFLEYFNMLGKDHVYLLLVTDITAIDGRVALTDATSRDAWVEAMVQDDFQKYVETIIPEAKIVSSTNDEPIKFVTGVPLPHCPGRHSL